MTNCDSRSWSWREIADLLASDMNKKLNVKLLDTIFFHRSKNERRNPYESDKNPLLISIWLFTSKKGNIVRRKKTHNLTLRHIYDRFFRFAMANPCNNKGPRIICALYDNVNDTPTSHFTAEQFEREIKYFEGGESQLQQIYFKGGLNFLQCYLRPFQGIDQIFRVIVKDTLTKSNDAKKCKNNVAIGFESHYVEEIFRIQNSIGDHQNPSLSCIEEFESDQNFKDIWTDLKTAIRFIVAHIKPQLISMNNVNIQIVNFTADFIVDDNQQLWLCKIPQLVTKPIVHQNNKISNLDLIASTTLHQVTDTSKDSSDNPINCSASVTKLPDMQSHTTLLDKKSHIISDKEKCFTKNRSSSCDKENVKEHDIFPCIQTVDEHYKTKQINFRISAAEHEFRSRNHIEVQKIDDTPKAIIKKLTEKIASMESRVRRAKKIVLVSAQATEKEQIKNDLLHQKLSALRLQFAEENRKRDDEYSRQILHLKSQLNLSKAEITEIKSKSQTIVDSDQKFENKNGKELFQKIQTLHQEILVLQRRWGEEKRSIISAHSAAQQELSAKHRDELFEHRSKISSMEDNIMTQREQFMELEKEKIILSKNIKESELKNNELINSVKNLKSEIKLMKQSLDIANSNETLSNGHLCGESGEVNMKIVAMETQIHTLTNKIEYLKAQLSSEATNKVKFTARISKLQEERDRIMTENRSRIRIIEEEKEKELNEMQERIKHAMNKPLEDTAILEGKIATLQAQIGDSAKDVAFARKKEDIAKSELMREKSRLRLLQKELSEARNDNETAREEIKHLKEANQNETSNEAMLRRLDNERRYLKNQLQNEIDFKKELEKKILQTTKQYQQSKDEASAEIECLEKKIKKEFEEYEEKEKNLKSKNLELQAEVGVQNGHISEIKQDYIKVRDQLRLDQVASEQLRATCQRLSAELMAAQDELQSTKSAGEAAIKRHAENTKAISMSIKHSDIERANEILAIKDDMRKALQESSDAQIKMIQLRENMNVSQREARKRIATVRAFDILCKRVIIQKARAFTCWCKEIEKDYFIHRIYENNAKAMQIAKETMRKQVEAKIHDAAQVVNKEKEECIKRIEKNMADERFNLIELAKQEKKKAIEMEKEHYDCILEQMKKDRIKKEVEMKNAHRQKILQINFEHKRIIEKNEVNHENEMKVALAKIQKDLNDEKDNLLHENEEKWSIILKNREKHLLTEMNTTIENANKRYEMNLRNQKQEMEIEQKKIQKNADNNILEAIENEKQRMQKELFSALKDCEEKWEKKLNNLVEEKNKDIMKLEENHSLELEKQLHSEIKRKEEEWKMQQESLKKSIIQSTIEKEKKLQAEAVENESSKWKQIVIDLENRLKSENDMSYKKGYDDRNAKALTERQEFEGAANAAVEKVKKSAKENLNETLNEMTAKLKAAHKIAEKDKEVAVEAIRKEQMEKNERKIAKLSQDYDGKLEEQRMKILEEAKKNQEIAVCEAKEREKSFSRRLEDELSNEIERRRKAEEMYLARVSDLKAFAEKEIMKRVADAEQHASKILHEREMELQSQFQQDQIKREKNHQQALHDAQEKHKEESQYIANEIRKKSNDALGDVVREMEAEHKLEMDEMKRAISKDKKELNKLNKELSDAKSAILENEDRIETLKGKYETVQKSKTFTLIQVHANGMKQLGRMKKELRVKDHDVANAIQVLKEEFSLKTKKLEDQKKEIEQNLTRRNTHHQQMYNTLVNHKREILIQQKKDTVLVSDELEQIECQRESLENERKQLEQQMKKIEDGIREVEKQIQLHSAVSTVQDGQINISHARKKRRMDEEFEQLLTNIEMKRKQMAKTDGLLKDISSKKEKASDKMRRLERTLVEVLVEQQKRLLSILTTKDSVKF